VNGIGNARDGFVYHPDGLDLASILAAVAAGRPITDQPGAQAWPSAIEGLRATEAAAAVKIGATLPRRNGMSCWRVISGFGARPQP
jgi:hypothetical protein